jgi:uncharacterized protein (TIGR02453 family)
VFGGGGMWHPDTRSATAIREAIVADPERWRAATRAGAFADMLDFGAEDSSLKRVPPGFDREHEFADDLRRRSFFGWTRLSEEEATAAGFVDRYGRVCEAAGPLVRFICDALALEY